jgi:uncharacterized protein DUF4177
VSHDHWEYRVLRLSPRATEEHVETTLNALGADGWELIAITQTVTHWKSGPRVSAGLSPTGYADQTMETLVHRAYLKRRKGAAAGGSGDAEQNS